MLSKVAVVLVRPRFPENIGMAARACANMGVSQLHLVAPERWDEAAQERAVLLATTQGQGLVRGAAVHSTLAEALAPFAFAMGTTARTGGWRRTTLLPEEGARLARGTARQGGQCALVFGPEDRGLANGETALCTELVTIPTAGGHCSLNLAQAVLLVLYECVKADMSLPFSPENRDEWVRPARDTGSRRATIAEEGRLFDELEALLLDVGHLQAGNSGWFMQPLRRFLRKGRLRRHEFDMIMGICRQIRHHLGSGPGSGSGQE
jgi:rRNA methylase